jgi:hypothetical protein
MVCSSTSDHRSPEQHTTSLKRSVFQAIEKQRKSLRNRGDTILRVKKRERKQRKEKEREGKKNVLLLRGTTKKTQCFMGHNQT